MTICRIAIGKARLIWSKHNCSSLRAVTRISELGLPWSDTWLKSRRLNERNSQMFVFMGSWLTWAWPLSTFLQQRPPSSKRLQRLVQDGGRYWQRGTSCTRRFSPLERKWESFYGEFHSRPLEPRITAAIAIRPWRETKKSTQTCTIGAHSRGQTWSVKSTRLLFEKPRKRSRSRYNSWKCWWGEGSPRIASNTSRTRICIPTVWSCHKGKSGPSKLCKAALIRRLLENI